MDESFQDFEAVFLWKVSLKILNYEDYISFFELLSFNLKPTDY